MARDLTNYVNARTFHSNFIIMADLVTDPNLGNQVAGRITDGIATKFFNKVIAVVAHRTPAPNWNYSINSFKRHDENFISRLIFWTLSAEAADLFVSVPFTLRWLRDALKRVDCGMMPAHAFQFDRCDSNGTKPRGAPKSSWTKTEDGARLVYLYSLRPNNASVKDRLIGSPLFATQNGADDREIKRCFSYSKHSFIQNDCLYGDDIHDGVALEIAAIEKKYA